MHIEKTIVVLSRSNKPTALEEKEALSQKVIARKNPKIR